LTDKATVTRINESHRIVDKVDDDDAIIRWGNVHCE